MSSDSRREVDQNMAKKRGLWFCQDCRVPMKYNEQDDFYKCPKCGIEVWYPIESKSQDEVVQMMQEKYKSNLPPKDYLPAGEAAKGGGGSSNGKSNSSAMKKKSLSQINAGLAGGSGLFESR